MTPLSQAVGRFWNYVVKRHVDKLSARLKLVAGMAIVAAIILVGTFGSPGTPKSPRSDRAVGLFGLVVFLGGSYATSRDRKNVNFQAVIVGVLMQFLLGLFVLRTQTGVITYVSPLDWALQPDGSFIPHGLTLSCSLA